MDIGHSTLIPNSVFGSADYKAVSWPTGMPAEHFDSVPVEYFDCCLYRVVWPYQAAARSHWGLEWHRPAVGLLRRVEA